MKATGRAALRDHLRAGGEMWLPASGASMYPYLTEGDLLLVRGLQTGEAPTPGQIVVLDRAGVLVAHFAVECRAETIYTRGSRGDRHTQATPVAEVCGVVVRRQRRPDAGPLTRAARAARTLGRYLFMLRK